MESKMDKSLKRNAYFDNIKGVLILLVVVGHAVDIFTGSYDSAKAMFLWIYSFHMPLFIFVSGYFSGNAAKSKKRTAQRVFLFLTLYLFYKIGIYISNSLVAGKATFRLLTESGPPWYLFAMAVYSIVLYFIKDIGAEYGISSVLRNPVLIISVIFALTAGLDSEIGDFLMLSRIIVYFPFFYFGYLLRNINIKEKIKKICPAPAAVIALIAIFIIAFVFIDDVYIMRAMFTGRHPYSKLGGLSDYGALFRLAAYAVSALMSFLILAAIPEKTPFRPITLAGKSSLQIYLYHRVVLYLLNFAGLDNLLLKLGYAGVILWLIISAVVAFVLAVPVLGKPVEIWQKIINKWIRI